MRSPGQVTGSDRPGRKERGERREENGEREFRRSFSSHLSGLLPSLSPNGRGEIRTHDTGFTGMPVFETGAFNHSATRPHVTSQQLTPSPAPPRAEFPSEVSHDRRPFGRPSAPAQSACRGPTIVTCSPVIPSCNATPCDSSGPTSGSTAQASVTVSFLRGFDWQPAPGTRIFAAPQLTLPVTCSGGRHAVRRFASSI